MNTTEPTGYYVSAIVIESKTTPKQRARNFALYQRLRDGVPPEQRTDNRDGIGLHMFQFAIPIDDVAIGTHEVSFRLKQNGECYRRLCSYIADHFDTKCDADDEVERLTAENAEQAKLIEELRTALATSRREREKLSEAAIETLGELEQARAAVGLAEQERDRAREERDEARRVADATAHEAAELLDARDRTIADLRTTNDELGKHSAACEARHREINEELIKVREDRDRWMRKESEAWGHCTKQVQALEAKLGEARKVVLDELVRQLPMAFAAEVDAKVRLIGEHNRLGAIAGAVECAVESLTHERDRARAAFSKEAAANAHYIERMKATEHELTQARASIAALTVDMRKYRALYEGQKLETEFAQATSTQLLAEVRKVNAMLAYERAMRTTAGGAS